MPNIIPDVSTIVAEANKYNITIFAVTLDMPCPQCLWDITSQTGGACFENVSSVNEARKVYMKILQSAQGNGPCEIEWKTGLKCHSQNTELEVHLLPEGLIATTYYQFPVEYMAELDFDPGYIFFMNKEPGKKHDTTITITARNSDFNVSSIICLNPCFTVSPKSFSIKDGDKQSITVSYTPSDSGFTYTEFDFVNDVCETKLYSGGGFVGHAASVQTLTLTHPNGGELFIVGSDTVITWEGIPPEEKVLLEYSTDNGITWIIICDTASGLSYKWNNIPGPPSNECLVRVKQINGGDEIPRILWEKTYGGTGYDDATSIKQTLDGGYIVGGILYSRDCDGAGNPDSNNNWILKLDKSGNIDWSQFIGAASQDRHVTVDQTLDGNYIFSSCDGKYHILTDFYCQGFFAKLDNTGKILWNKKYGVNTDWSFYQYSNVLQNNGFITTGNRGIMRKLSGGYEIRYNAWIQNLDENGNIRWTKEYLPSSGSAQGRFIKQLSDNCFIAAGSYSDKGYWLIKLDSSGNTIWEKIYGGSGVNHCHSILETMDGGYIAAGYTGAIGGDISRNYGGYDIWVIKLDSHGNLKWEKNYGGSGYDIAESMITTSDGCYVIAGYTTSTDYDLTHNLGGYDTWLFKIDPMGNIVWQQTYGGSEDDKCHSLCQTDDGGYVICGQSFSADYDRSKNLGKGDFWIVKLSADGSVLQEDISDSVFAIVAPEISSIDIDMGKVLLGKTKDSVITDFITNIGTWDCRIDSIYIQGADSAAFSLVSGIPQYTIAIGSSHFAEFGFRPTKVGLHEAEIVIISQSDTLIQNIRGEGIEPKLAVMCDWIDFGQVYLKAHKDTVKAIIENTGTASIEITKTEITGPDLDQFEIIDGGGSFTLAAGDERELTLRFKPEYLGKTSTNLNFYHKESGSPALTQLYGEGIKNEVDCDSTGFEYPNFTGVDDIILAGNTGKVDDYIRLTYAKQSVIGGIWHEKPVLVGNGFITEFSFRMSSGDNVNTDDGSLPGADGLAFVIQNNENIDTGMYGGGIGYHGIDNALAVEFDLFMNNSKQIIDFKDPNGNHAAIQKKYGDKLSALHNSNNTIEINEDISELKSDGTIYYVKIEYNIEPNVMSVYLDETGVLDDPVIVAGGIELSDIVSLKEDLKAFVGITSATGNAYEIHDLLDWYFCPFPVDITEVEKKVSSDDITINIYPNPASESTTIEINNPEYQYISLSITDIFGREVKSLFSGYKTPGNITFNWNTGEIPDGVYFCRLSLGDENMVRAIVVNK